MLRCCAVALCDFEVELGMTIEGLINGCSRLNGQS